MTGAAPSRGRLLVLYDQGAAGPLEIVTGLRPVADPVFAVAASPAGQGAGALLRRMGVPVVELPAGPPAEAVAALPPEALAVDGAVTFSERMLAATAGVTERLGTPGHRPRTALALTDKSVQRRRLAEAGADDVPSALVASAADLPGAVAAVGTPAVLKPATGEGSRATHVVPDAAAAAAVYAAAVAECAAGGEPPAPFVVERLLTGTPGGAFGDYVSVEVVAASGAFTTTAVTSKFPLLPPFREGGHVWPTHLDPAAAAAVRDLACRAGAALGVTDGLLHVEVKLTPDGPRVIEVNGRLGGYINELSRRALGVDLVTVAGRVALGEPPAPDQPEPAGAWFVTCTNPPLRARRLLAVSGVARARAHPAVEAYHSLVPPRSPLPDTVSTLMLDVIVGRADDVAAVPGLAQSARAELGYTLETADGERVTLRGDEMWQLNLSPASAGRPGEVGARAGD